MKPTMRQRRNCSLSVEVDTLEKSFDADVSVFHQAGMRIDAAGFSMNENQHVRAREEPKRQHSLVYEDLEIGPVIGQGSSSIVLQAVYNRYPGDAEKPMIALKVINMFERSRREQLIREIQSLYNCECRAIIGFYGAFYREGSISIALEYMNGGSLANVLAQFGVLPEKVLAHMTFQVLYGLAYLKRQKRVHRDIKPSNLLINSLGEVKVTDFGVSAELQNSIAMCGTFVGTFKYMSPERVNSAPYSYASDIWALGIVLLECASGRYPYPEDDTCIGMAQTILEADIPTPPPGSSTEFAEFVNHCLHKDPGHRLPAEILLTAPWLKVNSATSLSTSVDFLHKWIASLSAPSK